MRPILVLLLLVAGCKDPSLQPTTKCGLPCWTYKLAKADVGQCRSGVWSCIDNDESTAECVNQAGPTIEVCDQVDNNCDGRVDEQVTRSCTNSCGPGYEKCVDGVFVDCNAPVPTEEVCNGKDDDCDGLVDEPADLPIEFCYTGPPGSTAFGNCQPGSVRCIDGQKMCYGQVLPAAEVCNGLDDDCDGAVDEGLNALGTTDIVFVIDGSGSMASSIDAIRTATRNFATTFGTRTDLQWALVTAPDSDPAYGSTPRLVQDFTGSALFGAAVARVGSTGDGAEPTMDALHALLSSSNPMGLSWRPGSKHVIALFSDEPPQSWATPEVTEQEVHDDIAAGGTSVFIFTNSLYSLDWTPIVDMTGNWGQLRSLNGVSSSIEAQLSSIIQEASCQ